MSADDAIVRPVRGKRSPRLGPVAVMAATRPDLECICRLCGLAEGRRYPLYISELAVPADSDGGVTVAGPVVGAPYAAMILETLLCWGAREVLFCGWCGAIAAAADIGSLIVPQRAFIDEGTSRHYCQRTEEAPFFSTPAPELAQELIQAAGQQGCAVVEGPVWSTDAIYRETPRQVEYYRQRGCLAVEMELSALFSVASFRRAPLAGILVVSDDLSTLHWRPGFRKPAFRQGRHAACRAVADLALRRLEAFST